jgi:hypothetical protein
MRLWVENNALFLNQALYFTHCFLFMSVIALQNPIVCK